MWGVVGGEGYVSENLETSNLMERSQEGGAMHVLRLVKRTIVKTGNLRVPYTVALVFALVLTAAAVIITFITTAKLNRVLRKKETPDDGERLEAEFVRREQGKFWNILGLESGRFNPRKKLRALVSNANHAELSS